MSKWDIFWVFKHTPGIRVTSTICVKNQWTQVEAKKKIYQEHVKIEKVLPNKAFNVHACTPLMGVMGGNGLPLKINSSELLNGWNFQPSNGGKCLSSGCSDKCGFCPGPTLLCNSTIKFQQSNSVIRTDWPSETIHSLWWVATSGSQNSSRGQFCSNLHRACQLPLGPLTSLYGSMYSTIKVDLPTSYYSYQAAYL